MVLECPRAKRLLAPHQLPDRLCSGSPTGLEKQTVSKAETPGASWGTGQTAGATRDGSCPLPTSAFQCPYLSFPQTEAA